MIKMAWSSGCNYSTFARLRIPGQQEVKKFGAGEAGPASDCIVEISTSELLGMVI
jgi:hypothetical protein